MGRFVEGADRSQLTLLPDCLKDWIDENNAVHVIDAFVEALDLRGLGFARTMAKETGRPSCHPSVLLKLCIYGYLNRVQSSHTARHQSNASSDLRELAACSRIALIRTGSPINRASAEVEWHCTTPMRPTDNAIAEAFNSRVRVERMNAHRFMNPADAREKLEAWRRCDYEERSHGAIGDKPPISLLNPRDAANLSP